MYIRKILLFILAAAFAFGLPSFANETASPALEEVRGVWVATAGNADYPLKPTTDAETLKNEAISILDNAQAMGLNAVFLQVRPGADAFYRSEYFPWSRFLTGREGTAPDQSFDPLSFWVDEAHQRGIALHAWISPYRVVKSSGGQAQQSFSSLASSSPAAQHREWVVEQPDGSLYFNPGIPEVKKLIVDSTLEIISNYAVDGIHFDGFFYPDNNFNDKAAYERYRQGNESLADWRRSNVTTLIRDVYTAIKASGKEVRFGVSPFGIWANRSSNPLGSATSGQESYHRYYADSLTWIREGIIDYIAPQVFWNIGYSSADYNKLAQWWKNAIVNTKVDLYMGLAAYKACSQDKLSPWYGTTEIVKQLELNRNTQGILGSVFSGYSALKNNGALASALKGFYQSNTGNSGVTIPVSFSRPLEDIRTSYSKFYLNGASDPTKPLYLNGKLVENRSKQGYFGIFVSLREGNNTFTITQGTSSDTRVFYRIPSTPVKPMQAADIVQSSVYPQSMEYRAPGEKITLSCKAPAGATVTVELNGKKYTMTTSEKPAGTGLYPVTYTYTYTLPTYTGDPRVVDLGNPVYTMTYKGTTKTRKAPATVGVIMEGAPYYAEVAKDMIFTYDVPDTDGGGVHELYLGMVDYVTGLTGSFARLSTGQYVQKSVVKIFSGAYAKPVIQKMEYVTGEKWDLLKISITGSPAAYITADSEALKLHISAYTNASLPALPEKALISSITKASGKASNMYTLKLRNSRQFEGYSIEKTADGLVIHLKHRVYVQAGDKPLTGITIMVDPGHGGAETGTLGPLGLKYAEKDLNLDNGFRLKAELEALGATVLMTRTKDMDLSLNDRLMASKKARPDMFISIHANSMADNVDNSQYFGFSTYYREAHARSLSQGILDHVTTVLNRKNKGIHKKNFYVIRGTWTPSLLIECGFVPNPTEFEWLTDAAEQQKLMKTIAEAIVKYFSEGSQELK